MPYEEIEEQPIKSKAPRAYETGATPATPPEPLEKDSNWSTADHHLSQDRAEAHRERLQNETRHYNTIHPYIKPKPRWGGDK